MVAKTSTNTQILLLIAFGLFSLSSCATTFTATANERCAKVDLTAWQLTETERVSARLSSNTPVYISGNSLSAFLDDKNYGQLFKGVAAYFVVILILLVLSLAALIVFIAFCCCCRRYNNISQRKTKVCCSFAFIFFGGFILLFVLMIIYLAMANKQYTDIRCVVAKVPADLLEGETDLDIKFMGFDTLNNQLNALKSDVDNFSLVSADFDAIDNRDIDTKTQSSYSALPIFYNKYKDSTTRNGSGSVAKPSSISSLTEYVSDAINVEFTLYVTIGTALNDVAQNGNRFVASDANDTIKSALNQIITFVTTLITPLKAQMTSINNSMDTASKFVPIGTYVALALGLLVFFLASVFMIVLCCRFTKQRCLKGTCCLKAVLIILSILTILLVLISILLLVTTTGVSTICRVAGELLSSNQASTVLAKYNITFKDQTITDTIDRCVSSGASGDIASLIGASGDTATYISYISQFLDGITDFQSNLSTVTSGALDSTTVVSQTTVWGNIQVGLTYDHSDISSTLSSLNSLVSCGGVTYVLNSASCPSSSTDCRVIATTSSFVPPSCTTDTASGSTYFTILKNYYSDENTLMGNMITDIGSTSADTANNRFRTAKQAIRDSETNFTNIKNQVSNTFAAVSNFDQNFTTLTDCRIVRTEIENFESVICFKAGKKIYLFFCFTVFAAFALFVLTWFLCGTMRCIAEDEGHKMHPRNDDIYQTDKNNDYQHNDKNNGYFRNDDKSNGYFNDEKVPL